MKSLQGKTALITGASKGIGRAVAVALAQEGVNIGLISRSVMHLDEVAKEIRSYNVKLSIVTADVTDIHEVVVAIEKMESEIGSIDIFINNGDVSALGPFIEFDPIQLEQNLKINLLGLNYLTRAILPSMVEKNKGNIINISSTLSIRKFDFDEVSLTFQSKYEDLTVSLMEEVKRHNIQFSNLTSGSNDTVHGDLEMESTDIQIQPSLLPAYILSKLKDNISHFSNESEMLSANPF